MIETFDADEPATPRASTSSALIERMRAGEFEVTRDALRGALLRLPGGRAPLPAPGVAAARP